jgi:diaminopimelate decarboxylase
MGDLLRSSKKLAKAVLAPIAQLAAGERHPLSLVNWGLTALPGLGLALEGASLHELSTRWGSPLFVVHGKRLRANAAAFTQAPTGATSGCEVFYSYKTNPVPGVLRMLHTAGIGAEVTSDFELWLAIRLGVPGERIVYNGSCKSETTIREALRYGICVTNLNHAEEIPLVARIARELSVRARVGLRIATGTGWTGQFGTPVEGGAAIEAFRQAIAEPALEVVGVHAHQGKSIRTERDLSAHLGAILGFVESLHDALGYTPRILNLGGSLCTPTVVPLDTKDLRLNHCLGRDLPPPTPADALDIGSYVAQVIGIVTAHFKQHGRSCPRIFLEPGRAMTGNAQHLVTTVRSVKRSAERTHAILDTGINHAEAVRAEYHQLFPVKRFAHPVAGRYTVVGPICTPGDMLYGSVALPELASGDTLVIMDAGAYFVPFSTSFSFPRPAVVLLDDGCETLLRRAETFEDMIHGDQL